MGFSTMSIAAMAATGAQTALDFYSNNQQSKELKSLANQELANGKAHANSLVDTALNNNARSMKNMNNQVGKARLDASASNLASSGSVYQREVDLTTRLQDEISHNTESALQQANLTYSNAVNKANSTYMSAQAAKVKSVGSLISGVGSIFGQVGNYQNTLAQQNQQQSQLQQQQKNNSSSLWSL